MLPAPTFGALISPYWEHYDPSALTCGGTKGRVAYGELNASAGSTARSFLVSFDGVRSCGGGHAAKGSMSASWQLALHSDGRFDIVLQHVSGDAGARPAHGSMAACPRHGVCSPPSSPRPTLPRAGSVADEMARPPALPPCLAGTHTIGFQSWYGREAQVLCIGSGDAKCAFDSARYSARPVAQSYRCPADDSCSNRAPLRGSAYAGCAYSAAVAAAGADRGPSRSAAPPVEAKGETHVVLCAACPRPCPVPSTAARRPRFRPRPRFCSRSRTRPRTRPRLTARRVCACRYVAAGATFLTLLVAILVACKVFYFCPLYKMGTALGPPPAPQPLDPATHAHEYVLNTFCGPYKEHTHSVASSRAFVFTRARAVFALSVFFKLPPVLVRPGTAPRRVSVRPSAPEGSSGIFEMGQVVQGDVVGVDGQPADGRPVPSLPRIAAYLASTASGARAHAHETQETTARDSAPARGAQ